MSSIRPTANGAASSRPTSVSHSSEMAVHEFAHARTYIIIMWPRYGLGLPAIHLGEHEMLPDTNKGTDPTLCTERKRGTHTAVTFATVKIIHTTLLYTI